MKGRKAFDRKKRVEAGQGKEKKEKKKNRKRETIGVLLEIQVKGLISKGEKKPSRGGN